jgi:hypothetical protein
MTVNRRLVTAIASAALLLAASAAQAKGPQGIGQGLSNSTPASSHGLGSDASTPPPGWDNAKDTKGWQHSGGVPPGFDSPGKANGWSGDPLPPGLEKR